MLVVTQILEMWLQKPGAAFPEATQHEKTTTAKVSVLLVHETGCKYDKCMAFHLKVNHRVEIKKARGSFETGSGHFRHIFLS